MQNALDLRTEQGINLHLHWSDGIGVVEGDGPGLEPRHLAFGVSEKGHIAIGQFGEGLKLAALVFAREDAEFQVESGNMMIVPEVVRDTTLQTDVLALNIHYNSHSRTGTRITFACTEEEFNDAEGYFAELNVNTRYLDEAISLPAGKVYVNGAMVQEVDSLFSYHLTDSGGCLLWLRGKGAPTV